MEFYLVRCRITYFLENENIYRRGPGGRQAPELIFRDTQLLKIKKGGFLYWKELINDFYTQVVDNRRIITSFFWSIMNHY
jgi:hypothetical protein